LFCQGIKLVGERHRFAPFHSALTFADHVHEFDADQDAPGRLKRFETGHRPCHPFDGAMILLECCLTLFFKKLAVYLTAFMSR